MKQQPKRLMRRRAEILAAAMQETERKKKMAETHQRIRKMGAKGMSERHITDGLGVTQETFRRHEKEWEEFHRVEAATDSVRDFLESFSLGGVSPSQCAEEILSSVHYVVSEDRLLACIDVLQAMREKLLAIHN